MSHLRAHFPGYNAHWEDCASWDEGDCTCDELERLSWEHYEDECDANGKDQGGEV